MSHRNVQWEDFYFYMEYITGLFYIVQICSCGSTSLHSDCIYVNLCMKDLFMGNSKLRKRRIVNA